MHLSSSQALVPSTLAPLPGHRACSTLPGLGVAVDLVVVVVEGT